MPKLHPKATLISTGARRLGTFGFAAGLWGCGIQATHSNHRSQIIQLISSTNAPATYSLDDRSCQSSALTSQPLTSAHIHAWDGTDVNEVDVPLTNIYASASLNSEAIDTTIFSDKYERYCDFAKPEGHWCDDDTGAQKSWSETVPGSPLRICQDGHAYNRNSYEAVGLTSIYFIQAARARYDQLAVAHGAAAPKKVTLKVMPEFIDYYDNYPKDGTTGRLETWITHNLAYFPQSQMIAVFPERAKDVAAGAKGYFWESRFVLGHEYGHHIDFTRHGQVLANMGLRWDAATHSYIDTEALQRGGSSSSDRAQVFGAMSEAFADMLSYYAEGGNGRSLIGLPDIGANRDLANAMFSNGDAKILTAERLNVLYGRAEEDPGAKNGPSYADIHIIGAIISYTANQVFAHLTAGSSQTPALSPADIDARYVLTLNFMDAMVREALTLKLDDTGAKVLAPLGRAIQAATETFLAGLPLATAGAAAPAQTPAQIKAAICELMRTQMPALEEVPFAQGNGC